VLFDILGKKTVSKEEEVMSLELLPNEILFDVFNYFNGIELLRSFYGLNFRFNFLLHNQFLNCSFKFNSISKRDFDKICQQHLPVMADYITTLDLSDNEETPTQIELFLSYMPSFNRFTQLRLLSVFNLRSYETLMSIIDECHHLSHLDLFDCYFEENQIDLQLIVNHIWSLSKLIHCRIGIGIKGQNLFRTPTTISLSLEYVSIERTQVKLSQIDQLFEYTPGLKYLSISVPSFADNDYIPSSLPTLIDLSISSLLTCNASRMTNFLQNIPNLRRLNVSLSSEIVDGNQWEELIRNYLPNLKVFQFKTEFTIPPRQNIQERVDNLINSFQSSFWIDEHQWFVRCLTSDRTIYLYTLSNPYEKNLPVSFKSSCPYDDQQDFYNNITKIISPTFFDQPIPAHVHMPKINDLCINLPLNEQFWTVVPNLKRLNSLKILFHNNAFQSQVQALLNRAPHLNRLSINQHESTPLQTSLFKYTNVSVRELDLRNIYHYFNEEECITLSRSSLGVRCEVLYIRVKNRESIITLVKNMINLRTLDIYWNYEKDFEHSQQRDNNDEYRNKTIQVLVQLVQWLKDHLPSTCLVVNDSYYNHDISIWI